MRLHPSRAVSLFHLPRNLSRSSMAEISLLRLLPVKWRRQRARVRSATVADHRLCRWALTFGALPLDRRKHSRQWKSTREIAPPLPVVLLQASLGDQSRERTRSDMQLSEHP